MPSNARLVSGLRAGCVGCKRPLLDNKDAGIPTRSAAKVLADAVTRPAEGENALPAGAETARRTGERAARFLAREVALPQTGERGHTVGPDLGLRGDKSPKGLMVANSTPTRRRARIPTIKWREPERNELFSGVAGRRRETGNRVYPAGGTDGKQRMDPVAHRPGGGDSREASCRREGEGRHQGRLAD